MKRYQKMRAKPFILILITALFCLWLLYPTIRNNMLQNNSDIETTYYYSDGQLVETPQ